MDKKQIDATPRKEARSLLASIPAGPGYDDRVLLAVEQAMNLEWWRGYHAAIAATLEPTSEMVRYGETAGYHAIGHKLSEVEGRKFAAAAFRAMIERAALPQS